MFAITAARSAALGAAVIAAFAAMPASAQLVVPQSALTPSGQYYTDIIGGGIGSVVVMTGGGNDPGIGLASGRNDDGYSAQTLGFTLNFFGTNYTSFFANNNGNISFVNGISAFVPTGPTGAASPVISPYFADVDTRASNSGVLHIRKDIANEVILTWDNVGFYNTHGTALDSFQLVVRGPDYSIPNGEGTIGFFYKDMPWISTDTSTTAAVGFGDGAGHSEVLAGSNTSTINSVLANHYVWFDQNLVVVPPVTAVPEPETYALMLAGLGAIGAVARRRRKTA